MCGSILNFWAIHPLVPGYPGSVRFGVPLIVWLFIWTSHWLVTPISSVPPLPQYILQEGEIVPFVVLWFEWCPSYTNLLWLQKMTGSDYSSLLGVSSRITLVHSRFHYNSENTTLLL